MAFECCFAPSVEPQSDCVVRREITCPLVEGGPRDHTDTTCFEHAESQETLHELDIQQEGILTNRRS